MRSRTRQAGVSAIEVTIIVLVVGTLAAIAIPNVIEATQSYNVRIAADALAQQLNRCRQEAVRVNLPMQIKVESQTTSINLNRNESFTDDGDGSVVTFSQDAVVTEFDPEDGIVTYSSRGEMQDFITPEFRVVYGARARRVTVDPRGAVTVLAEEAA